jgi:hypothetical protein
MYLKIIHLRLRPGDVWVLWCIFWQQVQVLQGGVGHVAGEGGTIFLKLVRLGVGDVRGPTATQRHAAQPLVV